MGNLTVHPLSAPRVRGVAANVHPPDRPREVYLAGTRIVERPPVKSSVMVKTMSPSSTFLSPNTVPSRRGVGGERVVSASDCKCGREDNRLGGRSLRMAIFEPTDSVFLSIWYSRDQDRDPSVASVGQWRCSIPTSRMRLLSRRMKSIVVEWVVEVCMV